MVVKVWADEDVRDLLQIALRNLDDDDAADARNIAERIDAAIERDQSMLEEQHDELLCRGNRIRQLEAIVRAARQLLRTLDNRHAAPWDRFHHAADVRAAMRESGDWS